MQCNTKQRRTSKAKTKKSKGRRPEKPLCQHLTIT